MAAIQSGLTDDNGGKIESTSLVAGAALTASNGVGLDMAATAGTIDLIGSAGDFFLLPRVDNDPAPMLVTVPAANYRAGDFALVEWSLTPIYNPQLTPPPSVATCELILASSVDDGASWVAYIETLNQASLRNDAGINGVRQLLTGRALVSVTPGASPPRFALALRTVVPPDASGPSLAFNTPGAPTLTATIMRPQAVFQSFAYTETPLPTVIPPFGP